MYQKQIQKINETINKTGKAIISIGCSFVQGQGAVNDELYVDYNWTFEKNGVPLRLDLNKKEINELLIRYPSLYTGPDGKIDFTFMEYENSFVNVLCEKYFENEYAPINLGIRGCGNRASIKDLYFYPEIHWDNLKEIIVLYVPSGLERFDFINDGWNDHHHWKCIWPHYKDVEEGSRKTLWKGYHDNLYSDKFEVLEQIGHAQELLTWCKLHNAKLVITPAFDRRYTKEHFTKSVSKAYNRIDGNLVNDNQILHDPKKMIPIVDLFPWDNLFYPEGAWTFIDLLMKQEHPNDWQNRHFFEYLGKGSKNLWITSCIHPSAKGHDLFAKRLFEYLENT